MISVLVFILSKNVKTVKTERCYTLHWRGKCGAWYPYCIWLFYCLYCLCLICLNTLFSANENYLYAPPNIYIYIYIHPLLLNYFTDLYSNRLFIALLLLLLIVCVVKYPWLKPSTALHICLKCWLWGNFKTMRYFAALTQNPLKLRERLSVCIHTPCGSKPEIRPTMSWEMAPQIQNGGTQVSCNSASCSDGDKPWRPTNPCSSCKILELNPIPWSLWAHRAPWQPFGQAQQPGAGSKAEQAYDLQTEPSAQLHVSAKACD